MVSKSIIDYIERMKRLYQLIKLEKTGNCTELARKMHVTKRTIQNYMSEFRSLGAVIIFDNIRNTYRFDNNFVLHARFEVEFTCEIM